MLPHENKIITACIIVRLKSKRLPNKALLEINGFSMTEQLIRRIKQSKYVNNIVICTSKNVDDKPLIEKAKDWGVECYAGDEDDVLLRMIQVSKIYNSHALIRITGDNPCTDHENLDKMIIHHFAKNADYTRTNRLPFGVTSEVMATRMVEKLYNLIPNTKKTEYMSFFSFNPEVFKCEVLYPKKNQDRPYYSLTVDYQEDLNRIREIYSTVPESEIPSLDHILNYIDNNKDNFLVDKEMIIKTPDGSSLTYENLLLHLDELAGNC
jgi:spore coat polysaccharide biosynthesis protein SpsF